MVLAAAQIKPGVFGSVEEDTKTRHKTERERRLQVALRENLHRRKAQARGRAEDENPSKSKPASRDSGDFRPDED